MDISQADNTLLPDAKRGYGRQKTICYPVIRVISTCYRIDRSHNPISDAYRQFDLQKCRSVDRSLESRFHKCFDFGSPNQSMTILVWLHRDPIFILGVGRDLEVNKTEEAS